MSLGEGGSHEYRDRKEHRDRHEHPRPKQCRPVEHSVASGVWITLAAVVIALAVAAVLVMARSTAPAATTPGLHASVWPSVDRLDPEGPARQGEGHRPARLQQIEAGVRTIGPLDLEGLLRGLTAPRG